MPKCEICKKRIEELFLGKLKGTIIKEPGKRKFYYLCSQCQKELGNAKNKILEKFKK